MRAIIITRYGGPEALQLAEVPDPHPREDGLLVRIEAASVNSGDVRMRALDVSGPFKLGMRLLFGCNRLRQPILGRVYAGFEEAAALPSAGQTALHLCGRQRSSRAIRRWSRARRAP